MSRSTRPSVASSMPLNDLMFLESPDHHTLLIGAKVSRSLSRSVFDMSSQSISKFYIGFTILCWSILCFGLFRALEGDRLKRLTAEFNKTELFLKDEIESIHHRDSISVMPSLYVFSPHEFTRNKKLDRCFSTMTHSADSADLG